MQTTLQTITGRGQEVDVTVSSIGDAKSLRGGTLLLTPLRGIDGEVYAVAQGNLIVGGMKADGQSGSSVTVNIPTTGIVSRRCGSRTRNCSTFNDKPEITLNLKSPISAPPTMLNQAMNKRLGNGTAKAMSSGRIVMRAPMDPSMRISFALLDDIPVEQGRDRPKVVFNSRTGTVVMGQDVRIQKAAVSHGSLTISVQETPQVSLRSAIERPDRGHATIEHCSESAQGNNMFVW